MLNVGSKWKPIIIELNKVNFPVAGINIWPQIFQAMFQRHLGLSENSVPLHPVVNDHYPY